MPRRADDPPRHRPSRSTRGDGGNSPPGDDRLADKGLDDDLDGATERALLRAAAAGDRDAAGRLVEATYGAVFASLMRFTRDPDLAADLTQETYRKAWSSLAGFRGGCRFGTWLYRIAYHAHLDHVRRPRPVDAPLDDDGDDGDDGGLPATLRDDGPDPEQRAHRARRAAALRRAILELPEHLRFTVTAHYWRGLSPPEIARLEDISAVAVRKRLRVARDHLAAVLEESP